MNISRKFYIMRANKNSEDLFIRKNIVGIGWSNVSDQSSPVFSMNQYS